MYLAFALPAPAETGAGGGADYIHGLVDGLREIGAKVDVVTGPDPVFPPGAIPIIDGMLLPTLHDRLDELARSNAVALIHHIAAAAGRDDLSRDRVRDLEQAMLPRMRRVVATSAPVAQQVAARFAVDVEALPPGTREFASATPDVAAPKILSVGVLTRRKGHDKLLREAARLLDLPWQVVIAGDTQRDPAYPAELRALADDLGLADRTTFLTDPAPDELERNWCATTVFALATNWEGYPSAVAEALQRGIPVVTTSGANAEPILPMTAGAISPADDMATFGKCLRRLLFDDALRADMAAAARTAGMALPRWPDRARQFAALLEQNP